MDSDIHIRTAIRRDFPFMVGIEAESFPEAWTHDDFQEALRVRNNIGMVIEADGLVLGFLVYEINKHNIRILNLAIAEAARREGFGRMLLAKMKTKLRTKRTRLLAEVHEMNLQAQQFLKSCGFLAISMNSYEADKENSYLFAFISGEETQVMPLLCLHNRCTGAL